MPGLRSLVHRSVGGFVQAEHIVGPHDVIVDHDVHHRGRIAKQEHLDRQVAAPIKEQSHPVRFDRCAEPVDFMGDLSFVGFEAEPRSRVQKSLQMQ